MTSKQYTVAGEGFEIRFSLAGGILRAQVEGLHDSFAITLAYWTRIAEERRQHDVRCVLVIENLVESGNPEEVLRLFGQFAELGFQGSKVAFVDCRNGQRSAHEHIAIMAREHGILAAVFDQENAAEIWLRHGEE